MMIRGGYYSSREVVPKRITFGDMSKSPFVEGCDGKWYHKDTGKLARVYTLSEILGVCKLPCCKKKK